MLTAKDIAQKLADDAQRVCRELLPHGKPQSGEWCVGSIHGEAGQSLRVHLSGHKAGLWADFNEGGSGDLLDLWAAVRRLSIAEAIREAKSFLGIAEIGNVFHRQPRKQYERPDPQAFSALEPDGAVAQYLRGRGLSDDILHRAGVVQSGRERGMAAVFRYLSADGEHLHTKFLALERRDGKKVTWSSKQTRPVLYGWNLIPDHSRAVVLVEGEIDCLTLNQLGIPALSVPMGGGRKQLAWLEHEFDRLERFDDLFLALDNDPAGHEARDEILERLGAHRCRIVDWPEVQGDPNACLMDLGWQRQDFMRAIRAARAITPEELAPAEDYRQDVQALFANLGARPIHHLFLPWLPTTTKPFEFAPGELTIWTGSSGHGKTTVLNQAMNFALGRDYRVCIASLEIQPAQTLYAMARQATATDQPTIGYIDAVFDNYADKLWLFRIVGKAKSSRMLEVFGYAKARFGVQHFVVDSLLMLDVGYEDWSAQTEVVQRLVDFAVEHNVHVHLVAHAKKIGADRTAGQQDVRGAGGITDLASNVIVIWANQEKQVDPSIPGPDASLTIDKNRRHGWRGRQVLDFDPPSLQMIGGDWPRPMPHVGYSTIAAPASSSSSGTTP